MRLWKIESDRISRRDSQVRVIGITGGVGAGKSRILQILQEEYHARILLADEVAAELEEPGKEGYRLLVERFGKGILKDDKRLDRSAFAELIFKDERALHDVNAIIHPLTWQLLCETVEELAGQAGENGILIAVEAALFDGQSRRLCDALWFIDTSEENRIRRLIESRGYTREKCQSIIHNQPCREDFLALADSVIDNNGTIAEVREQIARLLGPDGKNPLPVKK